MPSQPWFFLFRYLRQYKDSGSRQYRFKSWLCYFPALWPWAGYLTALSIGFHICKMGLIIAPTREHCRHAKILRSLSQGMVVIIIPFAWQSLSPPCIPTLSSIHLLWRPPEIITSSRKWWPCHSLHRAATVSLSDEPGQLCTTLFSGLIILPGTQWMDINVCWIIEWMTPPKGEVVGS